MADAKIRQICLQRAEQVVRDGLTSLQGEVVALIGELGVEGLLTAEDLLNAAGQPRGLEHPRIVAAINALADKWVDEAIRKALDSIDGQKKRKAP